MLERHREILDRLADLLDEYAATITISVNDTPLLLIAELEDGEEKEYAYDIDEAFRELNR